LNPDGFPHWILSPAQISPNNKTLNQLRQIEKGEVPTVVPSSSEFPFARHIPSELAKVVIAWPGLPPIVKAGILAMINASASGQEAE
jgi:hypothetical protein